MAGHSKWANIKHKKGAQDAKRSKVFQKLTQDILIAIKQGGNNIDTNNMLRVAIDKAKENNLPSENIKRLLSKKDSKEDLMKEVYYEGYDANGAAILVKCFTDNLNRAGAQVKSVFNKSSGKIGTPGSVSYMFDQIGIIVLDSAIYDMENIIELLIEEDIIDILQEEDNIIIKINPSSFINVKKILIDNKIDNFIFDQIEMEPNIVKNLSDEQKEKLNSLISKFESLEDVVEVYTNSYEQ